MTPSDEVTYHETTAQAYLRMARNKERYTLHERADHALRAAEHLIKAEGFADGLMGVQEKEQL